MPDSRLIRVLSLTLLCLPVALPAIAADLDVRGDVRGVPNFHAVDERVYRGAQPRGEGWKSLAGLGVKTVIDLRRDGENGEHSIKAEREAVQAAGMRYVNIPLNGLSAPSDNDMARLLALLASKDPVFVHCRYGRDRTGMAVACYRIAHDSWANEKALREAKSYGIHWFEISMKRYIIGFRTGVQHAGASVTPVPALAAAKP